MAQLLNRFIWFDGALQKSLDARGHGGVRRLESMCMVYVHAGVRRPTELARLLGVTRQSVNTALRELEEKGLIYMAPDPEDARCKLVSFAPEGAAMRQEAKKTLQRRRDMLMQAWSHPGGCLGTTGTTCGLGWRRSCSVRHRSLSWPCSKHDWRLVAAQATKDGCSKGCRIASH